MWKGRKKSFLAVHHSVISVICARRPPSSAAILRQHPGPQDATESTAGHRERRDNISGYSRRRWLSALVSRLRHTCARKTHTDTGMTHKDIQTGQSLVIINLRYTTVSQLWSVSFTRININWKYQHLILKKHLILKQFVTQVLIRGCRWGSTVCCGGAATCVFLPLNQWLLGWIPALPWPRLGISSSKKMDGYFTLASRVSLLYCCFQFFNSSSSIFCYPTFLPSVTPMNTFVDFNQSLRVCISIKKELIKQQPLFLHL